MPIILWIEKFCTSLHDLWCFGCRSVTKHSRVSPVVAKPLRCVGGALVIFPEKFSACFFIKLPSSTQAGCNEVFDTLLMQVIPMVCRPCATNLKLRTDHPHGSAWRVRSWQEESARTVAGTLSAEGCQHHASKDAKRCQRISMPCQTNDMHTCHD